jgi:hypothetical protein
VAAVSMGSPRTYMAAAAAAASAAAAAAAAVAAPAAAAALLREVPPSVPPSVPEVPPSVPEVPPSVPPSLPELLERPQAPAASLALDFGKAAFYHRLLRRQKHLPSRRYDRSPPQVTTYIRIYMLAWVGY